MKNSIISMLAILFIAFAILSGCKKDEGNDCGGDLTRNPDFASGLAQFNLDGQYASHPQTEYESGAHLPWRDSLSFTVAEWKFSDSALLAISISNTADTIAFYESLRTGTLPFVAGSSTNFSRGVEIAVAGNQAAYSTLSTDNSGSTFEITDRNFIVVENGDSVVTIRGIFCCNVRRIFSSDTSIVALQGNFDGKFLVE